MPTTKDFKLEELSKYFHMPEKAVAKELGICLTSLKKLCRSYGITRWPFRKLKSIQRTLAKVQDETSPGMASQIQTAGIGQEASKDAPKPVPGSQPQPIEGDGHTPSSSGRGGVVKKRKAYQLGGKTLMLTEEEKSIYELTIGKSGTDLKVSSPAAMAASSSSYNQTSAQSSSDSAAASSSKVLPVAPSPAVSTASNQEDKAFACNAVGASLHIRNWSNLWTQEHLQKRLLEPLGGTSLSLSPNQQIAYLNFENDRTAQRAELICRAAAAAAEKNMKAQIASRSSSPLQRASYSANSSSGRPSMSPTQEASQAVRIVLPTTLQKQFGSSSSAQVKVEVPMPKNLKEQLEIANQKQIKLEIPVVSSVMSTDPGSCSGLSGPLSGGHSPVFKSTPTTPPTSFTNYLFESNYDGTSFGSMLMPPSTSSGLHFDFPESGSNYVSTSCVEVSSTSIMGGPDDMTMALMAGTTMSGTQLGDSVVSGEHLSLDDESGFIARSPPCSLNSSGPRSDPQNSLTSSVLKSDSSGPSSGASQSNAGASPAASPSGEGKSMQGI
mmetsp:Transcript_24407/g.55017  ORF Transcript_24407/g.55017 Transcript_24407/m.55017 type:complete len:552 (-) Transcript_24407:141-1796(-)